MEMTDRRSFFGVAAMGAAAAAAGTNASAQAAPLSIPNLSANSLTLLRSQVSAALPSDDQAIKEWLSRFDPNLDTRALNAIKAAGDTWLGALTALRHLYDPTLSEQHLSSASQLLDQALAYRNELAALEIAGFGAALQYLATRQSLDLAVRTIPVQSGQKPAAKLAEAYKVAEGLEKEDGPERARTRGQKEAAEATAANEKARETLSLNQINVAKNLLQSRRTELLESGSASNFAERHSRLSVYFLEDLQEAYQKALAASLGLAARYNLPDIALPLISSASPPPAVSQFAQPSGNALDSLVGWTRKTIKRVELLTQDEFDFPLLLSLRQSLKRRNAAGVSENSGQLVPEDAFQRALDAEG
jgi:hypothetical protein